MDEEKSEEQVLIAVAGGVRRLVGAFHRFERKLFTKLFTSEIKKAPMRRRTPPAPRY